MLRSVTLSLQGMDDTGEKDIKLLPKLESAFNKIGVTLYGQDNQLKSTFEIMKDLSEAYKTLDDDTKSYYSALIGGKTQVDVVNSVLGNFQTAIDANTAALEKWSPAWKENESYMQSIEAAMAGLKASFEGLVNSVTSSELIIDVIHGVTGILDILSSEAGTNIIKFVALTAVWGGAEKALLSLGRGISTVITIFKNYNSVVEASKMLGDYKAITSALKFTGVAAGLAAVTWAVSSFKKEVNSLDQELEDSVALQTKGMSDIKEEWDSANTTFKETQSNIEANKATADIYIDTLEELTNKTNLNQVEQVQLNNAIKGLNELFPELGLAIDSNTGKLNTEISTVRELVDAYGKLAIAKAYATLSEEAAKKEAEATLRAQSLERQIDKAKTSYQDITDKAFKSAGVDINDPSTYGNASSVSVGITGIATKINLDKKQKELTEAKKEIKKAQEDQKEIIKLQVQAENDYQATLKKYGISGESKGGSSDGGGIKTSPKATSDDTDSTKKKEDALKKLHDSYQKVLSDMEYQLEMAKNNKASDEEQISMYRKMQETVLSQRAYYQKIGLSDNHEYIQALNRQWWSYEKEIESINEEITKKAKEAQEKALSEQADKLDAYLELYNLIADERQEAIDKEIEALEKEKDALQERNDEIEDGIELKRLEDALNAARQKKVRVWRSGKGWVGTPLNMVTYYETNGYIG